MCLTIQFPNPCPLGCEASIALVQLLIDKVGELRMVCVHILASLIAICSLSPPSLFLPPALPAVFFFFSFKQGLLQPQQSSNPPCIIHPKMALNFFCSCCHLLRVQDRYKPPCLAQCLGLYAQNFFFPS